MATEKRLIDANALLHNMCERCNIENEDCPCEPPDCFIYDVIANAPTVDAVEVVRCKDCKYWECGKDYEPYCNHWGNMMSDTNAEDFCSYGERRAGE